MRLAQENKNFLANTDYIFKGKQMLEDNLCFERKLKTTKSVYHVDKFESDYKRSLELKKLRQRCVLKKRSVTSSNFYPKIKTNKNLIKIEEHKTLTSKNIIKIDSGIVNEIENLNNNDNNNKPINKGDKANTNNEVFLDNAAKKAKEQFFTLQNKTKNHNQNLLITQDSYHPSVEKSKNNSIYSTYKIIEKSKNENSHTNNSNRVNYDYTSNLEYVSKIYDAPPATSESKKENFIKKDQNTKYKNLNTNTANSNTKSPLIHEFSCENAGQMNNFNSRSGFDVEINYRTDADKGKILVENPAAENTKFNDVETIKFSPRLDKNQFKTRSSHNLFTLAGIINPDDSFDRKNIQINNFDESNLFNEQNCKDPAGSYKENLFRCK